MVTIYQGVDSGNPDLSTIYEPKFSRTFGSAHVYCAPTGARHISNGQLPNTKWLDTRSCAYPADSTPAGPDIFYCHRLAVVHLSSTIIKRDRCMQTTGR